MAKEERLPRQLRESWHVLLIAALATAAVFIMVSGLKSLPSPIYGGDLWNHLGTMYHIYYGGSVFESAELAGEYPWVPELYHVYNVALAKIIGIDPLVANIYSSVLLVPIAAVAVWSICSRMSKDKIAISASLITFLTAFPIFKYTQFASVVMAPALFACWYLYLDREDDVRRLALLAAVMGLCSLSNTQLFVASYILFGVVALDKLHSSFRKKGKLDAEIIGVIKPLAIIFAVSFAIALIYWYAPIFVYRLHTPNDIQIYGWADFSRFDLQISYPLQVLWGFFFNLNDPVWALIDLGMLLGAYVLISRRDEPRYHLAFLILVASLIGVFHHLLTYNLFHLQLAPDRIFEMFSRGLGAILLVAALDYLAQAKKVGAAPYAGLALAIIVFSAGFAHALNPESDQFYMQAKNPLPSEFTSLQSWIRNNTGVDDVFLTDNEDAFMMNALSGRKSVSYRRTHTSEYADMDQRNIDEAVILYGTDDAERLSLLQKYRVKYVLWTSKWVDNQIAVQNGSLVGIFDPLEARSSPAYVSNLEKGGVQYFNITYYLDPAFQPNYPKYQMVVIPPQGESGDRPWSPGFDARLTKLYEIDYEGAPAGYPPFAVVYGVRDG